MCPKITYAGMELKGDPFIFNRKACAHGTCDSCGVDKFFDDRLKNLRLSMEETTDICRFESVERHWGNVQELTKRTVSLGAAFVFIRGDLKAFNKHVFKDRWLRRVNSLQLATQLPNVAHGKADYAAGLSFCSIESITCAPDNFAYLEVFFVSINRRMVGDAEVFTNLVFYYFGEAASKWKSNDARAHEANQKHLLRILKEEYRITSYHEVTDGCKAQYVCKYNMSTVAGMQDANGINMTLGVCEPACGKSSCDSASKEASRIINNAVKDGDYVPRGYDGWLTCRGSQPKKAALYKQWEIDEDAYSLKNIKGQFGVDKHYWFFSTGDDEQFNSLSAKYPGEIVLVNRQDHFLVSSVTDITKNRSFTGLSDSMLGVQEAPCHCDGCRTEENGVPQCMHDDVSGRSRRTEVKMLKVKGIAHSILAFEERDNKDGSKVETEVERVLLKAEVVHGKLAFINEKVAEQYVKLRSLLLFKRGIDSWGIGVVKEITEAGVVVDILLVKGGKASKEVGVAVLNAEVKALSSKCPQKWTVKVSVEKEVLGDLDKFCV